MPKFMFVFRGGGYASPGTLSPTELQQHLGRWNAWTTALMQAGNRVDAHALEFPAAGQVVRGRDRVVTDGPYAESKDLVSGILIVEAASLQAAATIARDCPILEFADGSVEVRPVLERPAG